MNMREEINVSIVKKRESLFVCYTLIEYSMSMDKLVIYSDVKNQIYLTYLLY